MRLSVHQENLARALNTVSRVVPGKSSQLPVIQNVLLATDSDRLMVSGTDLETSVTVWIRAAIEEEGSITVPAKSLNDLVNSLSRESVSLNLNQKTQTLHLKCGANENNFKGVDADEFPPLFHGNTHEVGIEAEVLSDMIQKVVFAASEKPDRPVMTGVYLRMEENRITMVATDGFRLAIRMDELLTPVEKRQEYVIPRRALMEVQRIVSGQEGEVTISLPANRDVISFHIPHIDVSAQLISGKYPDFENIIPSDDAATASTLYAEDLMKACSRAMVFTDSKTYRGTMRITPPARQDEPGTIQLYSSDTDLGDNEGRLDAQVEGDELEIGFNLRYLVDMLRASNSERIVLQASGSERPISLRPETADKNYIYIMMPLRT